MKNKILAIFVSIIMICGLVTGCSNSGNNVTTSPTPGESSNVGADSTVSLDGTWPAETVKIGVVTSDTTDEQFIQLQSYFEYLTDYYNLEFMYSESIADASAELDFIDSCASAGCDAILSMIELAGAAAVEEAFNFGMYYYGSSLAEQYSGNELFLGMYHLESENAVMQGQNGDYCGGYEMGYNLVASGVDHILFCSGGVSLGIQKFVDRANGFYAGVEAAKADGYDVRFDQATDVVDGFPGTDAFVAAQVPALASDYDAIACAFNCSAWFQPISDAGKSDEIKLATIGLVCDEYYEAVQNGQIAVLVYDCEETTFASGIPLIINAVIGDNDLSKSADGSEFACYRWSITEASQFNAIYNFHDDGNWVLTAEEMAACFKAFNEDASYESIAELYRSYTLDEALKKMN